MQKLLEVKNQKLSELQQAPARRKEPKPVEPPKQEPSKPVEAKPAEPKAQDVAKPSDDAKASEPAKLVVDVRASCSPASAASRAAAGSAKKPAPPPPPPPPEPELLQYAAEDPLLLAAGGGVLAILAGGWLPACAGVVSSRRSRKRRQHRRLPARLNSCSDDRGRALIPVTRRRRQGTSARLAGSLTDEVDPVAEADVHMAMGAIRKQKKFCSGASEDLQRTAIHAKAA